RHRFSFRLNAPLPIDLHLIDIGNGIAQEEVVNDGYIIKKESSTNILKGSTHEAKDSLKNSGKVPSETDYKNVSAGGGSISPEQITSMPFSALLKGMLNKNLSNLEPRPVSFSGLMSVMQEQMLSPGHVGERFGDRSYAIIADKYLNFSSRVGYHYSVVDAYCGETVNKNYITFSFKGGAADDIRKNRRVRSIALILEAIDFTVDVKEDKVDARLQKYPCSFIKDRLDTLGRLLIFTRQMDMLMTTEKSVSSVAKNFIAGNYKLST
ncbi:MAG: hypothetical protein HQK64_14110, partial [Desulfamplus sp.]|nr:hypothetical protein [Desulfamplus sp.]